jgi:hypothetical protein
MQIEICPGVPLQITSKNETDIHVKNLHDKSGLVLLDRGCRNVFLDPFFVFPDKIRRKINRNFEDPDPWSLQ